MTALSNEFIFNFLCGLVGHVFDRLLFSIMIMEVVVELAYDLLHEVLSMRSLGVLVDDVDRIRRLSNSDAV